ncbi:SIR2 family protein [Clostridium gasigenes]|uniref:SIR2 family protein n=1 Tax=Clostridium gasigenes TaxID=94869 RepID=UPI0014383791|nr:SIR2 family protein [Clostridium gasigenes]NKF07105.1 hypothetical protein [Clostridium gasigenes]QSW19642.1 SIR2 family protein [Clostridium gasigenes]
MAINKYLEDEFKDEIIKVIDSNNLNILIGAGFSANILNTLGNLELIMEIIKKEPHDKKYLALEALLYWKFFEDTIYPMADKINNENLSEHSKFLEILKNILSERENTILQKQVNIFTTNYDVILEYALESKFIEYNDGFQGSINPYYSTANYNKIYYKQALFTNRRSEIAIFNVYKIHGSINWKENDIYDDKFIYGSYITELNNFYNENNKIIYNEEMIVNESIEKLYEKITTCKWENIKKEFIDNILEELEVDDNQLKNIYIPFKEVYKKSFKIVSPTKEKFSDTLVDKNYYELLRIYCNELERENAMLLVFGFSFYDEHIEDITKRALNNPSLILIIICYSKSDKERFSKKFEINSNVWIVGLKEWECKIDAFEKIEIVTEVAVEIDESESKVNNSDAKIGLEVINKFLMSVSREVL